ncbi:ricin B lectin domain-containing protein [Coprinopsis sp. MPI-PUGE-AT-0042]|nr:ricin B lectin domain-containing protein [Coprinopsis sp. MPI-PUGE-AT-0042]
MGRFLSSALFSLALGVGSCLAQLPTYNIHPKGQPTKCVEIRGGIIADGTPVQIYDCNGTTAQKWFFSRNTNSDLRLVDGGLVTWCIDAGSDPSFPNGTQMKLWRCDARLDQQAWYIGDDGTIQLTAIGGTCLDLPDGRLDNTNVLQTWQCSPNNNNQLWDFTILNASPTPSTA